MKNNHCSTKISNSAIAHNNICCKSYLQQTLPCFYKLKTNIKSKDFYGQAFVADDNKTDFKRKVPCDRGTDDGK